MLAATILICALQDGLDKLRDVCAPFAEGWELNPGEVEDGEKIFPEMILLTERTKVRGAGSKDVEPWSMPRTNAAFNPRTCWS